MKTFDFSFGSNERYLAPKVKICDFLPNRIICSSGEPEWGETEIPGSEDGED